MEVNRKEREEREKGKKKGDRYVRGKSRSLFFFFFSHSPRKDNFSLVAFSFFCLFFPFPVFLVSFLFLSLVLCLRVPHAALALAGFPQWSNSPSFTQDLLLPPNAKSQLAIAIYGIYS